MIYYKWRQSLALLSLFPHLTFFFPSLIWTIINRLHALSSSFKYDRSGDLPAKASSVQSISRSGGYGGGSSSQDSCFDLEICPDLVLAAVAAFGAIAFFLLYQAITVAGRRRKRRSIQYDKPNDDDNLSALDYVYLGSFSPELMHDGDWHTLGPRTN